MWHGARVYPRERGEACGRVDDASLDWGLSPRTRGSRHEHPDRRRHDGSIPANAGKPFSSIVFHAVVRVYPRERGEAAPAAGCARRPAGLSPRTRGSPPRLRPPSLSSGSIPANAGKPAATAPTSSADGVYPRERGEADSTKWRAQCAGGLSPRTRGSRTLPRTRSSLMGSIPANAGKPTEFCRPDPRTRVYPRERGEAQATMSPYRATAGLSPRTRGSHDQPIAQRVHLGSIPANAGKPGCPRGSDAVRGVYPRERGEAIGTARGGRIGRGSIPANAGKPLLTGWRRSGRRVYPRERGEAPPKANLSASGTGLGLSPRTRGSPENALYCDVAGGSIPANAGKPPPTPAAATTSWVYPRERGEAGESRNGEVAMRGLSPRTRGSPVWRRAARRLRGSIPANAGKPSESGSRGCKAGVYPRERGEADTTTDTKNESVGLSPRTRGSHLGRRRRKARGGSIPANAGKPPQGGEDGGQNGVYPRERGEALDAPAKL